MLKKLKLYVIFASLYCSITHFMVISGFLSAIEESSERGDPNIYSNKTTSVESASLIKNVESNFRLDPMNNHQVLTQPKIKFTEKTFKTTKCPEIERFTEKRETIDLKTTTEIIQCVNEHEIKIMIQKTYRKLADNFRKLEALMKKQEEVENKVQEEKTEKVEGLNNVITIENVHSNNGNYTRVTLSKRKINEVRHRMPLPAHKNYAKT